MSTMAEPSTVAEVIAAFGRVAAERRLALIGAHEKAAAVQAAAQQDLSVVERAAAEGVAEPGSLAGTREAVHLAELRAARTAEDLGRSSSSDLDDEVAAIASFLAAVDPGRQERAKALLETVRDAVRDLGALADEINGDHVQAGSRLHQIRVERGGSLPPGVEVEPNGRLHSLDGTYYFVFDTVGRLADVLLSAVPPTQRHVAVLFG